MKIYIIGEKVDGFGYDIDYYTDEVYTSKEKAVEEAKRILKNRLEDIDMDDEIDMRFFEKIKQSTLKESFDACHYHDLFIKEISVIEK